MVKITNGKDVFEVTSGAYEGIYAHQGYTKVVEEKVVKNKSTEDDKAAKDEQFLEELLKKPLGEWNKNEIKRFAYVKEIDLKNTKSADEAKALIKDFLDKMEG